MTHTEPANPKKRSDEEIRADLDAWENAEPAWNIDNRVYLDKLSDRLVDDVAPLLAALAAARSDADQLRTENERLRGEIDALNDDSDHAIDARAESEEWYSQQIDAARVEVDTRRAQFDDLNRMHAGLVGDFVELQREVDTLRAKIAEATAAGIGAARIGKEIAIRHEYDAWLSELRDIEKQLMALARAVPGSPPEPTAEGPWAVDLIDCGRDDGVQVCATWAEADDFRQSYVAAAEGKQHCERQAIIHRAVEATRLGYHDRAPYLAADPVVPGSPETRQEEQRMNGDRIVIFADGSCQGGCLCEHDYECDYCGSLLAERIAEHDAAAVGGSPETPATTEETCEHGWTQAHNEPEDDGARLTKWRRCPGPVSAGGEDR